MSGEIKEAWFSYILPSGEWDRVYYQLTDTTLKFFYEESNVKDNKTISCIQRGTGMFEIQLCPDHQYGRDGVFILSWGGHQDRSSGGNDRHGFMILSATTEEMDDFLDDLCTVDDFGKRSITRDVKLVEDKRTDKSIVPEPNALKTGHNQHPALGPKKHMDWDSLAMKEAAEGLGLLVFSGVCYYGHDDEKGPFKYRYAMFRDWAIELYPDKTNSLEREMSHLIHLVGANLNNLGTYNYKGKDKFDLNTEYPTPTSPLPSEIMRRLPLHGAVGTRYTVFNLQPTQGKRMNHYFIIVTSHPDQLKRWARSFSECVRFIPTPPQSPRVAPESERIATMELNRSEEIMHTIFNQTRKDYLEDRLIDEIDFIISSENYVAAKQKIEILRMDLGLPPTSALSIHKRHASTIQPPISSSTHPQSSEETNSPLSPHSRPFHGLQFESDSDDVPPPPPPLTDSEFDRLGLSTENSLENHLPTQSSTPTPLPSPRDYVEPERSVSRSVTSFSESSNYGIGPQHDYISGSLTSNTKGGNVLKSAVSKKKRRFKMGSYDLDLTYITDRIIAMGFPSVGTEAVYRNDIRDVTRFFENRHPNHYKIYNLCSERLYPKSSFPRVLHFPFDDHNPPCFQDIIFIVRDLTRWLRAHPDNVAGIHCKAGKGRTGLIICILMLYIGMFIDVRNSLRYYASVRTQNAKGVTIPSQLRYVYMFQTYSIMAQKKIQQDLVRTMTDGGEVSNDRFSRINPVTNLPDISAPSDMPTDANAIPDLKKAYDDLRQKEEALFLARAKTEVIRVQQKIIHEELPTKLPAARYLQIKSIIVRGEHTPSFDFFTIFNRGKTSSSRDFKPIVTHSKGLAADKNSTKTSEELQQAQYYESLTPDQKSQEDFFAKSKNLYKHSRYPGDGHSDFIKVMTGPTTTYTFSDGQLPVLADFYVEFYKSSLLGKKRIFSFWLHTQFVEMGGLKVMMNKDFLDKANKAGGKDFQCEIILEPITEEKHIPSK